MYFAGFITSAFVLGSIVLQDYKYRAVSWVLFPLAAISLIFLTLSYLKPFNLTDYFSGIAINCGFVTLQLLFIKLYFSLKSGTIKKIINTKIGLGDILMFYTITVCFSPIYFIFFYIISLSLSVLIIILTKLISANTYIEKNVPLAGFMALFLLIFMLINVYLKLNPLDDLRIIKFLT